MIFVSLGTQDKEFKRLLINIENLIDKDIIKDKVIAQIGSTKYNSNKIELHDYLSNEEINKYMKEAKYIICHGGVGTIFDALKLNKKIIAVSRLKKYKEHVNDHQLEIISEFKRLGYLLDGTYNLEKCIKEISAFKPKYISNNTNFVNLIDEYIKNN